MTEKFKVLLNINGDGTVLTILDKSQIGLLNFLEADCGMDLSHMVLTDESFSEVIPADI